MRATSCLITAGTSGRSSSTVGLSSDTMASKSAAGVVASNGSRPVSISNITAPSAQMSAR
jgi:hypothetical protein